jgi:hypothetical protein
MLARSAAAASVQTSRRDFNVWTLTHGSLRGQRARRIQRLRRRLHLPIRDDLTALGSSLPSRASAERSRMAFLHIIPSDLSASLRTSSGRKYESAGNTSG